MCLFQKFEQLSFAFDPEEKEAYNRGYNTGVNWDANWMPGGPHVYTGTKLPLLAQQDQRKYEAWHRGFKDGLTIRMQNAYFAEWWNEHRNKNGYHRYYRPEVMNQELL